MFSKGFFLHSAALCVFLSAGVTGQAGAATGGIASLETKWTVGPISASAGDDVSHCSMKATYSNGHMLVFARNDEGGNSMAVDIGQAGGRLDVGRRYGLELSVPPYVTRQAQAVAATPQVLIFQMGQDPSFYQAVRQSKRMVIAGLSGTSQAYSLSGTSAGLQKLDDCVRQMNPGYVPDSVELSVNELNAIPPSFAAVEPASGFSGLQISVEPETSLQEEAGGVDADVLRAENKALELEKQSVVAKLEAEKLRAEHERRSAEERLKVQQEQNALLERLHAEEKIRATALAREKAEKEAILARLEADKRSFDEERARLESERRRSEAERARLETALKEENRRFTIPAHPETSRASRTDLHDILVSSRVASSIVEDPAYSDILGVAGYRWQEEGVFGSVQRLAWQDGVSFEDMVAGYMETVKDRCPADFAATSLVPSQGQGKEKLQTTEIACMGLTGSESAAALLFVGRNGEFLVVSHESAPESVRAGLVRRQAVLQAIKDSGKAG